jgi:soluble cytochrome b562
LREALDECKSSHNSKKDKDYTNGINQMIHKIDGYDRTSIKDYRRELNSLQKNIDTLEKKLCI